MATKLYISGSPGWKWSGVIEYDTESGLFVHHPGWPQRSLTPPRSTLTHTPYADLVRSGHWKPYYGDPELQLQEGM